MRLSSSASPYTGANVCPGAEAVLVPPPLFAKVIVPCERPTLAKAMSTTVSTNLFIVRSATSSTLPTSPRQCLSEASRTFPWKQKSRPFGRLHENTLTTVMITYDDGARTGNLHQGYRAQSWKAQAPPAAR